LNSKSSKNQKVSESARTRRRMKRLARGRVRGRVLYTGHHRRRHRYYEHFTASSFIDSDETTGDATAGEDPVVRQAAADALGNMNGTVLAIEPTSGRILAMVNHKLALSSGAQPCSTIKLSVALAALSEDLITKDTAIANGGTLYYLQHPTTADDVANFQPRVKRHLDIASLIPEISDGMAGAVTYGTARSVRLNFNEEEILGKTGTCSKAGTRYGWFASYAKTDVGRIVTVVFLQGGRPTYGPKAAEIAGHLYRNLYDHDFFVVRPIAPTNTA